MCNKSLTGNSLHFLSLLRTVTYSIIYDEILIVHYEVTNWLPSKINTHRNHDKSTWNPIKLKILNMLDKACLKS